jgi:phosphonatase-like hydrolase
MAIKLVVFDMAGTTVKDDDYVGKAFQEALFKYGYQVSIEEINPLMGYKKTVAISMMLEKLEPIKGKVNNELIDVIHDAFVAGMLNFYRTSDKIEALSYAEETFDKLRARGIKVALNTGFSKDIANVIIDRLKWRDKIDALVASDEVENGRPSSEMIRKIMAQLTILDPKEVAKVGDTEVDINEGKNVGCLYSIGITTGAFTEEELQPYEPTHIIHRIDEIVNIVT